MFVGKYSMSNLTKAYNENQPLIKAYLKNQSVEGLSGNQSDEVGASIIGLGVGSFLLFFVIAFAVYVWAAWAMYKYWDQMNDFMKLVAILAWFGFLGGPVVTLIIVYAFKQ